MFNKNFFQNKKFFTKITGKVFTNKLKIIEAIQPILEDHISSNVYNRLYPVVKFLDFFEKQNKSGFSSLLNLLDEFNIDDIVFSGQNSGPCFTLINNFFKSIPKEFNPHLISSKMSRDFQQEGWHPLSHVAIVINYQNPENCDDNGVVLLDPNFDIPIPLIFNNVINGCSIYMGPKRGTWHFKFDKDKSTIVCQSEKNDNVDDFDPMLFYLGYSVTNPHMFALRPMIATDRSLSIVSRDRQGRHIARLKLNLEKHTITRSVNGSYLPIQTFDQFLNKPFDKSYCGKLNLEVNELNSAVRKVINHQDILLKLRKEYLNNI